VALDPEHEIVGLEPFEGLDPDGEPIARPEHDPRHRVRVALVRWGHIERGVEPVGELDRVAPVPGARQHDRRLAEDGTIDELARKGERIEEQEAPVVLDRIRGDELTPVLTRLPLRVRCLPVPDARLHLVHGMPC
jgi:hypothetical protein